MVVVPGAITMAAGIMALEIVAVLDTMTMAVAIIALETVAVDSRALADVFGDSQWCRVWIPWQWWRFQTPWQ